MENLVPSTTWKNDVNVKMNGEKDDMVHVHRVNPSNVIIDRSNNVTVERIDYDTNVEIKKEDRHGLPVDEDESFVDDSVCGNRLFQGRKNISLVTSRHYAGHVRVFKEWLKGKGMEEDFEQWAPTEISNWLSEFFKESHLKHGGTKRASSLRIIRSALDHHLKSAPYCKCYSLTHSPEFSKANATLHDLEAAQKEYLDSSDGNTNAVPLNVDEVRQLWATGVVGIKTPKSLQRLVFLGVGINFGVTSRDDLRDLNPNMFEFHIDEKTGLEYATCKLAESTSSQLRNKRYKCTGRKMFSVPGSLQCPVAALKLFLEKRNPGCSAFFQIPNRDFASSGVWYRSQAAGLNCLSGMLKDMSHEALLPMDYSNHNLRATPPIVLYKAMEDVSSLRPARFISNAVLNNKIALNSPAPSLLNSVATTPSNIPTRNVVTNRPVSESNAVHAPPREMSTIPTGNVVANRIVVPVSESNTDQASQRGMSNIPTGNVVASRTVLPGGESNTVHTPQRDMCNIPTGNVVASRTVVPVSKSNNVQALPRDMCTIGNVSSAPECIPDLNNPQKLHHVLCIPQQWNIQEIVRAVSSGEAVVITKQSSKIHVQPQENGAVIQLQHTNDLQCNNVGRDRSGRKQPEPKRLRRDPEVIKNESSKVEDAYMKTIIGIKTSLQTLDDLVCRQQPSNQVIQELSHIGDSIQGLLQRIHQV